MTIKAEIQERSHQRFVELGTTLTMMRLPGETRLLLYFALFCTTCIFVDYGLLRRVERGLPRELDPLMFLFPNATTNTVTTQNTPAGNDRLSRNKNETLSNRIRRNEVLQQKLAVARHSFLLKRQQHLSSIANQTITTSTKTSTLPRLWVFVPTVRRVGDPDYLIQVLSSMALRKFPMSHVFVFHMANNERDNTVSDLTGNRTNSNTTATSIITNTGANATASTTATATTHVKFLPEDAKEHVRFIKAQTAFPDAHYITVTNNMSHHPPPTGYFLKGMESLPYWLQNEIKQNNTRFTINYILQASNDDLDRKKWRRKECFDFLLTARYVLSHVDHVNNVTRGDLSFNNSNDKPSPPVSNNSNSTNSTPQASAQQELDWIILNQDDGKWSFRKNGEWRYLANLIQSQSSNESAKARIVRLFDGGAVSIAFRKDHLQKIVDLGDEWCNWLPVDWLFDFYKDFYNVSTTYEKRLVMHIGKISTKHGRVKGVPLPRTTTLMRQQWRSKYKPSNLTTTTEIFTYINTTTTTTTKNGKNGVMSVP
ncbi:hypothetical protein ACA910_008329 [Epithemia clementina (nom. ined.)]